MDHLLKNQEINNYSHVVTCMEDIESENVGEELQRLSVIKRLPELIREDERNCREKIFPKLQQTIAPSSLELQREASIVFIEVLENELVNIQTYARFFLFPILFGIDRKDEAFGNIWVETLLTVIDYLPEDVIVRDILPLALFKARLSQTQRNRIIASKLLGKLATKFDSQKVIKDIYPLVLSLCQDDDEHIRTCVCSQLSLVARGLPTDMVRSSLIPVLVELGQDAVLQVRCEAIQTVVDIIPYLPPEELDQTIIPLVRKICTQAATYQDDSLNMIAKHFGSFCSCLEGSLAIEDKKWFISYYSDIIHIGLLRGAKNDFPGTVDDARYVDIRHQCSYNLPAIANLVVSSNNRDLLDQFITVICDLCADSFYHVRKTVGAGLHEVLRILDRNNVLVKGVLMALLCDTKLEVLAGVLSNFSLTVNHYVESGVLGVEEDAIATELGRSLLHCNKVVHSKHHNWRLLVTFLTEIRCLVKFMSSDFIYTHFVNQMFADMQKSVPTPCREAAGHTLLIFLRYNLRSSQRMEILTRLYSEYCHSPDFYQRKLFMKLCVNARNIFSKSYFKQHFFSQALSAAGDAVSNIRMLLAFQIPYLKSMLDSTNENQLRMEFEDTMKSFIEKEKDRDVLEALNKNKTELDSIKFDEVEDCRKYEEELKLLKIKPDAGPGTGIALKIDKKKLKEKARRLKSPPSVNNKQISPRRNEKENMLSNTVRGTGYGTSKWYDTSNEVIKSKSSVLRGNSLTETSRTALMTNNSLTSNKSNNMVYTLKTTLHDRQQYCCDFTNSCTCYLPFNCNKTTQDENLNFRALNIDTNTVSSIRNKFDVTEEKRKASTNLSQYKLTESCKYNMEMSWLNLETDLKNELYTLVTSKTRKFIPGDKYFNEKARFLTDFKNFKNNDNPSFKFKLCDTKINSFNGQYKYKSVYEDKNKIYKTRRNPRLFEEKLNFFEEKCRSNYLEEAKSNSDYTDCSCFDLTKPVTDKDRNYSNYDVNNCFAVTNKHDTLTNRVHEFDNKKLFHFSQSFERDFYRDAGVKIPEVITRQKGNIKLTSIPVYDWKKDGSYDGNRRQFDDNHFAVVKSDKNSVTNKRRTWFGNENLHNEPCVGKQYCNTFPNDRFVSWKDKRASISLDYILKDANISSLLLHSNDTLDKIKCESLPVNSEGIGIGQRSKSFVLPSTCISNGGYSTTLHNNTMFNPTKESVVLDDTREHVTDIKQVTADSDQINERSEDVNKQNGGTIYQNVDKNTTQTKLNEPKTKLKPKTVDVKQLNKTRIPVGRISSQSSPSSSRSSSPALSCKDEIIKDKPKPTELRKPINKNVTKQNSTAREVVSPKTKYTPGRCSTSPSNNKTNINRRSVDVNKITFNDKEPTGSNKAGNKIIQKVVKNIEEKSEVDLSAPATSSRLPIRKKKLNK